MMLSLAQRDEATRKRLIELLEKHVTRDADLRRIKPLIATLKNPTAGNGTGKNPTPSPAQNKAATASAQ
ncbi:MAG TPA: hypothetical protein VN428_21960 [Bryobacteraceae bacterium]|nr:hypothetical protein [Bryobacteraceae bacterium]